jgi:hypothetical protein
MSARDEIRRFVHDALTKGVPRAQVESVLLEAGWSMPQVKTALAGFAESAFPIPVPKPQPEMEAREAFLYLVLFLAMYLSAFNLGSLLFALIDWAVPQTAHLAGTLRSAIRQPVASLVVAVPVFLFTSKVVSREIRLDPGKRTSEIRRRLTYLTLFISACVLIGVFTYLVYLFLGSELSSRFALKAFTAAAIAGVVFYHYLAALRPAEVKSSG